MTVDGKAFELDKLDCLYVGRGSKAVTLCEQGCGRAGVLLSAELSGAYGVSDDDGEVRGSEAVELGSLETCNKRTIYKAIHREGIKSCQLVMGFTLLAPGSNWNTMPAHTHMRRSEVYFYFDVDPAHRVLHLMGPPDATSHLVMADKEVVVSPGWSIHAGVGTKNYGVLLGYGRREPGLRRYGSGGD